jgi:tetratricopeptide (TPR) repeat protein
MTGTLSKAQGGSVLGAVLKLLRADVPGTITGAPQAWPRWAALLPHVLAAANSFDSLPRPAQDAAGADVSWLLDRAAAYLRVHARLAETRPLAERALTITEAAHGPDHPDVATDLNNLALILQDLGQPGEARTLAERALTITEAAYGPDHPDVAIRLTNLATILQDLGQLAEARPLAERALAITEAAYGPDHPATAIRRTNLAVILADLEQRRGIKPSPVTSEVSGTEQQRARMRGNADDST